MDAQHVLTSLADGLERLRQEVSSLSTQQVQHSTWVREKLSGLEDMLRGAGVDGVSPASQQGPSREQQPGFAFQQQGYRPLPWRLGSSIQRRSRRFSETSKATFEDALEHFGSTSGSMRWSDSDSVLSRQPSGSVTLADPRQGSSNSGQRTSSAQQGPPAAAGPNPSTAVRNQGPVSPFLTASMAPETTEAAPAAAAPAPAPPAGAHPVLPATTLDADRSFSLPSLSNMVELPSLGAQAAITRSRLGTNMGAQPHAESAVLTPMLLLSHSQGHQHGSPVVVAAPDSTSGHLSYQQGLNASGRLTGLDGHSQSGRLSHTRAQPIHIPGAGEGHTADDGEPCDPLLASLTGRLHRPVSASMGGYTLSRAHSPPGPTTLKNRLMGNIPTMLKHAYEAQTASLNSTMRNSTEIHHPLGTASMPPDAFRHAGMASVDRSVSGSLAGYDPRLHGAATAPSGDLDLPRLSGTGTLQGSHVSPTGGGTIGAVHQDTSLLPSRQSVGSQVAAGRAATLIADAPALMLKSFTHISRPGGYGDLHTTSHAVMSERGGDAAYHMGYQGNALYVKTLAVEHEQMLGDEDDPYRPLTRTERLRLLLFGLINPEGRTKWDMFILVLLMWVCFASPLIVCFHLVSRLDQGDTLAVFELLVDTCFVVDIYMNFRTAYYDSVGNLVADRSRVARHYVRSWFLYDLASVVPFDLITEGMLGFLSMLKLLRVVRVGKVLRLLRMYRLMRVTRLPRIFERIEHYLDKGVLQMVMFGMVVMLLAHLSACLFHYMALLTYFITDSWEGTWVEAQGLVEADVAHRYVNSLYWAFATVATVGYGDITAKNQKEKVISILVMCSGVSLVGMVTSSITNIMSIRKAVSTKTAQKKQAVSDVLKSRQIPSALARRVRAFFNYESTKVIRDDEESLLQDLPFKLRSRFLQHAYMDTLSRLPCFVRLRPDILIDVISQLKAAYFTDGDIVALQGDLVTDMYFVQEGKLELRVYHFPDTADPWAVLEAVNKDELAGFEYTIQGRMKRTYYFGQSSAVHEGTWPVTVVARNCCELFCLSRSAMEMLATQHPVPLAQLLDVPLPPKTPLPVDHTTFNINLLRVETDPEAVAVSISADFPVLDAPPRKKGIGSLLAGAVNAVGQGLGAITGLSNTHKQVDSQDELGTPADLSVHSAHQALDALSGGGAAKRPTAGPTRFAQLATSHVNAQVRRSTDRASAEKPNTVRFSSGGNVRTEGGSNKGSQDEGDADDQTPLIQKPDSG